MSTNIKELIERLSIFDKNSTAITAANCLWFSWNNDKSEHHYDIILRTNALFITALALAKCNHGMLMDEASLRILCGELFEHLPDEVVQNTEEDLIQHAILHHRSETPLFSKIRYPEAKSFFNILLTIARHLMVQLDGYVFESDDLVRHLLIIDEFIKVIVENGYCRPEDINNALRTFIGTDYDRFVRTIWVMHTLIEQDTAKSRQVKAFFTKSDFINDNLSKMLDLNNGDFDIVSSRLAIKSSEVASRLSDIVNEKGGIYSKNLWILYDYPFIQLDDHPDSDKYLPISPWRILRKSTTYLSTDLINYLEINSVLGASQRAYKCRGVAYERYLQKYLSKYGLSRIEVIPPSGKKISDFLWEDDQVRFIIEAKVRLRPNTDPTFLNPSSLITSISTCCEAIEQAIDTSALLPSIKPTALIITSEEYLGEQVTQIARAAKRFGLVEGTKIDFVCVCPTAHLERALANSSPIDTYSAMRTVWENLDPTDLNAETYAHDFFRHLEENGMPDHIVTAWERVIPGFKLKTKEST